MRPSLGNDRINLLTFAQKNIQTWKCNRKLAIQPFSAFLMIRTETFSQIQTFPAASFSTQKNISGDLSATSMWCRNANNHHLCREMSTTCWHSCNALSPTTNDPIVSGTKREIRAYLNARRGSYKFCNEQKARLSQSRRAVIDKTAYTSKWKMPGEFAFSNLNIEWCVCVSPTDSERPSNGEHIDEKQPSSSNHICTKDDGKCERKMK